MFLLVDCILVTTFHEDHSNQSLDFFCRYNLKKLTYEERKAKLVERLKALNSAADDDE